MQLISLEPILELINNGGPVVTILLVLSVFATATIFLKAVQFLWFGIGRSGRAERAVSTWLSGRRGEAYDMVKKRRNPVDKTLAHLMRGIDKKSADDPQVREDVERVALQQIDGVRSYFRAIEAVVQVAPLLGLFGTVIGMIDAFRTLQSAGAEADPSVLAGGIWVALLTTAVGLAIAIPAALILYWFEGIAEREQNRLRSAVTSLLTGQITEGKDAGFSFAATGATDSKIQDRAA